MVTMAANICDTSRMEKEPCATAATSTPIPESASAKIPGSKTNDTTWTAARAMFVALALVPLPIALLPITGLEGLCTGMGPPSQARPMFHE